MEVCCVFTWFCYQVMNQNQGTVSLVFRDLSKILSPKSCIAEFVFLMRISSWNFACVPKAIHTKFQLVFLTINVISGIVYFHEIILVSLRNISETTPGNKTAAPPWPDI